MDHSMGHSMDHSNNSMDHSGHNMSNMTTGNSGSHMHHMMMGAMGTFHWSTTGDGIWINTWVPSSKGAYAGACFGMLFMTILYKGIPTLDAYLVAWRKTRESNICTIQSNIEQQTVNHGIEKTPGSLTYSPPISPMPSWTCHTIRSFLAAFSSFISYLLMMVVMTGNAGFFFVIIGGVFIGEMIFGRHRAPGGLANDHEH